MSFEFVVVDITEIGEPLDFHVLASFRHFGVRPKFNLKGDICQFHCQLSDKIFNSLVQIPCIFTENRKPMTIHIENCTNQIVFKIIIVQIIFFQPKKLPEGLIANATIGHLFAEYKV